MTPRIFDSRAGGAPRNTGGFLLSLKQHYWRARRRILNALGVRNTGQSTNDDSRFPPSQDDSRGWARYANHLLLERSFSAAVKASDTALLLDPTNVAAARIGIHARLHACDWSRRNDDLLRIHEGVRSGQHIIGLYQHRAVSDSELDHRLLAELHAQRFARPEPLWRGEVYRHRKPRIAYVSTDFRDHVISETLAECFETHDRSRFEIIAVSMGPDDRSDMRRRVMAAFDHVIDVQNLPDADTAQRMRELEVDIAVDLMGYSKRSEILCYRPAPVQVNYLGYPGTMGVQFMDYIIADPGLIPPENAPFFTEKIAYLPDTYLPQDSRRIIADSPSRRAAGLPEDGFVFAGYSETHKISPDVFAVWLRLLQSIQNSVLWLRAAAPEAAANLRSEAARYGISQDRLIFAPRLARKDAHLARLRLADIFLDTNPYNAHTTAADALWAGVPVVTYRGSTFPSRVAASLLSAAGLPELAADSLVQYEELALRLALHPEQLAGIKSKLRRNHDDCALFNSVRFTRNLETAYATMLETFLAGKSPQNFSVR